MGNLPLNVLDFNKDELSNNGASSNKSSSCDSSSTSCSSGSSRIFSELLRCHIEPVNVILETAN